MRTFLILMAAFVVTGCYGYSTSYVDTTAEHVVAVRSNGGFHSSSVTTSFTSSSDGGHQPRPNKTPSLWDLFGAYGYGYYGYGYDPSVGYAVCPPGIPAGACTAPSYYADPAYAVAPVYNPIR